MKLRWLLLGVLTTLVLVPALLLTTARMLDLAGRHLGAPRRLHALALGLYARALLLLLVAWWRGGAGSGGGRAQDAGRRVLCSGSALHAFWATARRRDEAAAAADKGRLRVIAANLRSARRAPPGSVEVAVADDVDVLHRSGGYPAGARRPRGRGLGQALAHRAGFADGGPPARWSSRATRSARSTGSARCSAATPWTCAARPGGCT